MPSPAGATATLPAGPAARFPGAAGAPAAFPAARRLLGPLQPLHRQRAAGTAPLLGFLRVGSRGGRTAGAPGPGPLCGRVLPALLRRGSRPLRSASGRAER